MKDGLDIGVIAIFSALLLLVLVAVVMVLQLHTTGGTPR